MTAFEVGLLATVFLALALVAIVLYDRDGSGR